MHDGSKMGGFECKSIGLIQWYGLVFTLSIRKHGFFKKTRYNVKAKFGFVFASSLHLQSCGDKMPFTMTKKKPPQQEVSVYEPFQMRLHRALRAGLEQLVERNAGSTLSSEISIAIRKHLEENGLWPPKPEGLP